MRPTFSPETLLINHHSTLLKSQISADLIYTAPETWSHASSISLIVICLDTDPFKAQENSKHWILFDTQYHTYIRVHKTWYPSLPFLDAFAKLRKTTISFVVFVCPSVRPSVLPSTQNNSVSIRWSLIKCYTWTFFGNPFRKFNFYFNLTRITGTLREDILTFMVEFSSLLLRMRNISDKVLEEIETLFVFNNLLSKILPFMGKCGKIMYSQTGRRWQCYAWLLYARKLRLETHTQNV